MKTLLLAAGVGSRLGGLTDNVHKSLLEINGDQTLLDYQLRALASAELNDIHIVVGHCAESVANKCLAYSDLHSIRLIKNDYYRSKNIDWSVYLGLQSVEDDVIYIEGDMVVHPKILAMLKSATADVCLIVDNKPRSQYVDTVVRVHPDNKVVSIEVKEHGFHTEASLKASLGEFVCAIKLSNRARRLLLAKLQDFTFDGVIKFYNAINDISSEVVFDYHDTSGLEWVEVDNVEDLARAKRLCAETNFGLSKGFAQ
ncbi:hypothetical protein C4J88_3545 [Pseudomonas sp. R4-39-08]|uniref:phosphocholine cytidylyltransferase family protein n=1 Tax=Pseudomonas sp. R4-39-08 TaxID=1173288 RepID=UPI000F704D34|nr:NTP transferase domain-containing protein [Pseudomonas sp. R4-39-08]AZF38318.1 hypothetical protein C4J88_3545 [Pseudomonas sp. R4-39-08]